MYMGGGWGVFVTDVHSWLPVCFSYICTCRFCTCRCN